MAENRACTTASTTTATSTGGTAHAVTASAAVTAGPRGELPAGAAVHRQAAPAAVAASAANERIPAATAVATDCRSVQRSAVSTSPTVTAVATCRTPVAATPSGTGSGKSDGRIRILAGAPGAALLGIHAVGPGTSVCSRLADDGGQRIAHPVVAVPVGRRLGADDRIQALSAPATLTAGATDTANAEHQARPAAGPAVAADTTGLVVHPGCALAPITTIATIAEQRQHPGVTTRATGATGCSRSQRIGPSTTGTTVAQEQPATAPGTAGPGNQAYAAVAATPAVAEPTRGPTATAAVPIASVTDQTRTATVASALWTRRRRPIEPVAPQNPGVRMILGAVTDEYPDEPGYRTSRSGLRSRRRRPQDLPVSDHCRRANYQRTTRIPAGRGKRRPRQNIGTRRTRTTPEP